MVSRVVLALLALLLALCGCAAARNQCPRGTETTVIRTKRQLLDCLDVARSTKRIPSTVGTLTRLTSLLINGQDLSNGDKFQGALPSQIGLLTNLEVLDVSFHRLTSIPFEALAGLTQLRRLAVTHNNLVQNLTAAGVGSLSTLRHLDARNNNIAGIDRDALASLSELTHLNLAYNPRMEGNVDARALQLLEWLNLASTSVSNVSLAPPMEHLRLVAIRNARLTEQSQFPVVAGMRNLWQLLLDRNNMNGGTLPARVWNLPQLVKMDFSSTNVSGPLLDDSANMPYLAYLTADTNALTGPFPSWTSPMPFLISVRLQNNRLSSVTANVGVFSTAEEIYLQYNDISEIRDEALPSTLDTLNLSHNALASFPAGIANLTNLVRVYLDFNALRGTLPERLERLTRLTNLFLEHNALSGPLPRIDLMTNAHRFLLNDNLFSGSVPAGIGANTKFEYLDLSKNRLTGSVPSDIAKLDKLRGLHLRDNPELQGRFPFGPSAELDRVRILTVTNTSFVVDRAALAANSARFLFHEFFRDGQRVALYMPKDELAEATQPLQVRYDEQRPGPPGALSLVLVYENDVTLRWRAPAEPNGEILLYNIRTRPKAGGAAAAYTTSPFSSTTVRDLLDNTAYLVAVQGETSAGPGVWSAELEVRTLRRCPAGHTRLRCIGGECPRQFVRNVGDPGCVRFCDGGEGTAALPGAVCDNSTLESLQLQPGFWRLAPLSTEVLRCPRDAYCRPQPRRALQATPLGVGDSYCSPNHQGVFCWGCAEGYALRSSGCAECTDGQRAYERGLVAGWAFLCLLLVLVPATALFCRGWSRARKGATEPEAAADAATDGVPPTVSAVSRVKTRAKNAAGTVRASYAAVEVRLRVVVGFFQVYLLFCKTFGLLDSGDGASASTDGLSVLAQLDVSALLDLMAVTCALPGANFYAQLLVYTMLPLAMVFAAWLAVRVWLRAAIADAAPGPYEVALREFAWFALFLGFLVYPGVSAKITEAFLFEAFQDDSAQISTRRLQADYSIEFEDSGGWTVYAGFMAFVYPIGVPLLYLYCLRRAHKAFCCGSCTRREASEESERQDDDASSTPASAEASADSASAASQQRLRTRDAFTGSAAQLLSQPYVPNRDWFECLELLRKLMLTSVFLVVDQFAPVSSPIVFLLMVVASYAALRALAPYKRRLDAATAEVALGLLLLLSLLPLVQRLGPNQGLVVGLASAVGVLMLASTFVLAVALRGKNHGESAAAGETHAQQGGQSEQGPVEEKAAPETRKPEGSGGDAEPSNCIVET